MRVAKLYHSLTRPIMVMGVPWEFMKILFFMAGLIYALCGGRVILSMAIMALIYGYGMYQTRREVKWCRIGWTRWRYLRHHAVVRRVCYGC